jgi:hypothetical protein
VLIFDWLVQGMTSQRAAEVKATVGPNELPKAKGTNWPLRFAIDVFGDFNVLLWVGGILCFIAYGSQYSQMDSPPGDNVCFSPDYNIPYYLGYYSDYNT